MFLARLNTLFSSPGLGMGLGLGLGLGSRSGVWGLGLGSGVWGGLGLDFVFQTASKNIVLARLKVLVGSPGLETKYPCRGQGPKARDPIGI